MSGKECGEEGECLSRGGGGELMLCGVFLLG